MTTDRIHLLRLRTPEGVTFSFCLASPLLRAMALMVDLMAVSVVWSAVALPLHLLAIVSQDVAQMFTLVLYFLLAQSYWIVAEWRWRGQTLGKKLVHLRVVDARGLRLSFSQVVLRNLLRFVDGLPIFYLVGGLAAVLNARSQRLGDLAADTLVVWEPEEAEPDLEATRSGKYNSLREYAPAMARLRQAVSPEEARTAWLALALARRDQFEAEARVRLFGELAAHFRRLGAVPAELADGVADEQFVRNVVDVLYVTRR